MDILNRIIELLENQNKLQKDLTAYLGISNNVFTDWKNGRNKSYQKYYPEIAEFLGVSVDYLVGKETKNNLDVVIMNEIKKMTDEEKQEILDFIRFKQKKK